MRRLVSSVVLLLMVAAPLRGQTATPPADLRETIRNLFVFGTWGSRSAWMSTRPYTACTSFPRSKTPKAICSRSSRTPSASRFPTRRSARRRVERSGASPSQGCRSAPPPLRDRSSRSGRRRSGRVISLWGSAPAATSLRPSGPHHSADCFRFHTQRFRRQWHRR